MNNPNELIIDTLTNIGMWGAIIATIAIIFIGWLLVKIKVLKTEWKQAFIAIVLYVAYPALIIKSFMNTTYLEEFNIHGITIGLSCAFYIIGGVIYLIWNKFILNRILLNKKNNGLIDDEKIKVKLDKSVNLWMMCIFGSTVFFGTPIISAIYGNEGLMTQIIWNTPFTIGLASFCQFQYLNIKFSKNNKKQILKMFLSPIVIVSIVGLLLWITQLIPGSYIKNTLSTYPQQYIDGVWWFDLKYTVPFIYKTIDILALLCSPLIWIAIGMNIANTKLKELVTDKKSWLFCLIKLVIIPGICMLIISGITYNNFNVRELTIITILLATPPATICVAYATKTNRAPIFASNASILTTLFTPIVIPIWVCIVQIYGSAIGLV